MKRGGHTPSEPGRAAGRQNLRPYGAISPAFNAVRQRRNAPHPPRLPPRLPPPFPPRRAGEGQGGGEGRGAGLVLAAVVLGLMTIASPVMARMAVILDFGDSLTAGYGVPAGQAFPARLEAWLRERGIAAPGVNAGASGDTTAGCLARLGWAVADKSDLGILAFGTHSAKLRIAHLN